MISRPGVRRVPVTRIFFEADLVVQPPIDRVRNGPLLGNGLAISQRSPYFSIVWRGTTLITGRAQISRKKAVGWFNSTRTVYLSSA